MRTLAFPSISTGAYRFPVEQAARIALRTVRVFLETSEMPEHVTFVCFDHRTLRVYQRAQRELEDPHAGG